MAFTPLSPANIEVGKPTKKEIFERIRTNFDDHETRILSNETTIGSIWPIQFTMNGKYNINKAGTTAVDFETIPFALTLTSAVITTFADPGSGNGTLTVDIQRAVGQGAFSTIFSTLPSVVSGGGAQDTSTNAVLSSTSMAQGDILRLDFSTVMSGNVTGFKLDMKYTT